MIKELIILSSIDWDFLWQRHQTIASFFLKNGWKVIYVDGTGIRNPRFEEFPRIIFKKYLGLGKYKNPIPKSLVRLKFPFLPPTYRIFRELNRKIFIPKLIQKIKETEIRRPVIIAYLPTQTTIDIINKLDYSLLIYDCVVNFKGMKDVPSDIEETENELVQKSDLIIADSNFLYKKMLKLSKNKVFQILPGVDYELFSRAGREPIKAVKNICFFGAIDERIDLDLIFSAAKIAKSCNFIFIGPVKTQLPPFPSNVIFHPPVRREKLTEKLSICDCLLLTYKKNELTKGIIPAKFFEALATGKPIIVSGIEDNIANFKDVLYTVSSTEEFIKILELIPELETEEKYIKRKNIAREHSWDKRIEQFIKIIEKNLT